MAKASSRSQRPAAPSRRKRRPAGGSEESLNNDRAVDLHRLGEADFGNEKIECLLGFDLNALASIPTF
jgi:hypothetical protein